MDWSLTKRKIAIFIPNYKRGNYIRATISQFNNQLPKDQYIIVVGNDGVEENFDDLKDQNVVSFTLNRPNPEIHRNGAFIRNYFIKRCESDILIQKDPETILLDNDYVYSHIVNMPINTMYRPSRAESFNKYATTQVLYGVDPHLFIHNAETIDLKYHFKMHHFFAVHTKILKDMRGYDEDFKYYGPEDQDMWMRLMKNNIISNIMTSNSMIVHLDHEFDMFAFDEKHREMSQLIHQKDPSVLVRNNDDWGNG